MIAEEEERETELYDDDLNNENSESEEEKESEDETGKSSKSNLLNNIPIQFFNYYSLIAEEATEEQLAERSVWYFIFINFTLLS